MAVVGRKLAKQGFVVQVAVDLRTDPEFKLNVKESGVAIDP